MSFEDALHATLGAYMRAPHWLRASAGRAYSLVPSRWRHGPHHARFAAQAAAHLFEAPWSAVEAKLEATLQAAAAIPAHHGGSAKVMARLRDSQVPALLRLRELPLTDKAAIKRDPDAFRHPERSPREGLPMFTGGSTAEPMRFWLERGVTRPRETACIDAISRQVLRADAADWTLSLRGRSVATAARAGGRPWTTEPIKRHLIFSSDHLEPQHMPGYVAALERLRPRWIHAFASAVYPLARWLRQAPCPAYTEGVRGILLTSENVYGYQLALLREVFPHARLVRHYGHSERALMAVAVDAQPYEVLPLYGLPELVDAQGRPIERPGELGELVATGFDNRVMPFVRYRTGDLACWAETPGVRQGQVRWTLQRIEGRLQEFVVCADHRLISVTTLGAAHFDALHRAASIQFEQHAPGHLVLKLVCPTPLSEGERRSIAHAVADKTQGGCRVEVQVVAAIERTARGKHRMLVQHLDLSGYLGHAAHRLDAEEPDEPAGRTDRHGTLQCDGEALAA
jgi:phenylacetate-CoA ligase